VEVKTKKTLGPSVVIGTGKMRAVDLPPTDTLVSVPMYTEDGLQHGLVEIEARFEPYARQQSVPVQPRRVSAAAPPPIPSPALRPAAAPPPAPTPEAVWETKVDPNSGNKYYVNHETQETTWTCPPELKQAPGPPPGGPPQSASERRLSLENLGASLASAAISGPKEDTDDCRLSLAPDAAVEGEEGLLDFRAKPKPNGLLDLRNSVAPAPDAAPAPVPAPEPAPVAASPRARTTSAAAVEEVYKAKLVELLNMGFSKDSAERALAQANNSVRGAVDILLGGGAATIGGFAASQAQAVPVPVAAPVPTAAKRTVYDYNADASAPVSTGNAVVVSNAVPVGGAYAVAQPIPQGARQVNQVPARQQVQQIQMPQQVHLPQQVRMPVQVPQQGGRQMQQQQQKPQLAPGWDERFDQRSGRVFYVNHNTKSTSWSHPGWAR